MFDIKKRAPYLQYNNFKIEEMIEDSDKDGSGAIDFEVPGVMNYF